MFDETVQELLLISDPNSLDTLEFLEGVLDEDGFCGRSVPQEIEYIVVDEGIGYDDFLVSFRVVSMVSL